MHFYTSQRTMCWWREHHTVGLALLYSIVSKPSLDVDINSWMNIWWTKFLWDYFPVISLGSIKVLFRPNPIFSDEEIWFTCQAWVSLLTCGGFCWNLDMVVSSNLCVWYLIWIPIRFLHTIRSIFTHRLIWSLSGDVQRQRPWWWESFTHK